MSWQVCEIGYTIFADIYIQIILSVYIYINLIGHLLSTLLDIRMNIIPRRKENLLKSWHAGDTPTKGFL